MRARQLATANIDNLTRLWRAMGSHPCTLEGMAGFEISTGWPYRCWPATSVAVHAATGHGMQQLHEQYFVPVWQIENTQVVCLHSMLTANGFQIVSGQTAMALALDSHSITTPHAPLLQRITSQQAIRTWTAVASRAFGYDIDPSVFMTIAVYPELSLYLACVDAQPAATVMLFKTGDVIGVHQLGVLPEFRGQGLARRLMHEVIALCKGMAARHITLQASSAAERLYTGLGFTRQFRIENYQYRDTTRWAQ
ncbi:MAG: GNAT family N-acetyltransferase [Granulosicoccaceae bacterium]|jgi:GNAT superfamily N-acetyltransferase